MSTPIDLADHVAVIERYVVARAASVFAGLYLDYDEEVLCVGFTRDAGTHLAALRATAPRPELVVAFTADATRRELENLADRILEDLLRGAYHPPAPIADVRVDIPSNRVAVTVLAPAPFPEIASDLFRRYGGLVSLEAVPLASRTPHCRARERRRGQSGVSGPRRSRR